MNFNSSAKSYEAINLSHLHHMPIGTATFYFQEVESELTASQAFRLFSQEDKNSDIAIFQSNQAVVSFGIGSKPIWLLISLENKTLNNITRHVEVDDSWLDKLDFYFFHQGQLNQFHNLGDSLAFKQRKNNNRLFSVTHSFPPGYTELLIRVETEDAIILPIYILNDEQYIERTEYNAYSYGILYGAIISLLIYNFLIFLSLKDSKYFYYSLYLFCFLAMNMAYTGHGFKWLWPEQTQWQMWCGSTLILCFNLSGLAFASKFLKLKQYFPKVNKFIFYLSMLFIVILLGSILLTNNFIALFSSMVFTSLFPFIMVILGLISLTNGNNAARYFLVASISATIGTTFTALTVWGVIPYNELTFRAVELGMLFDMLLLALALAEQVKDSESKKILAESMALQDPLTRLGNRRSLYEKIKPIWLRTQEHKHAISVILLDIDHFKIINDTHGHSLGDRVLKKIADIIINNARTRDIVIRWGGEELLMVLPNTTKIEASAIAERIRKHIEELNLKADKKPIQVTASFGIADLQNETTIDELINVADIQLYKAKDSGRNKVCFIDSD
jgi:diguanylate cyclase (GGDEF)-like protein